MPGFIIWCVVGCLFIVLGIAAVLSDQPVGFWNVFKMGEVTDVKKYNRAMGKLWCIAGGIFILLGVPLLAGQNSPMGFLSVAGCLVWVIVLMAVYELGIKRKYGN